MSVTLADLIASPNHYLHRLEGGDAVFVPMDRAAYQRSIFLDRRIAPVNAREMRVPLTMLADAAPPVVASSWIFHIAHCGSTLLARALDLLDAGLVLREPQSLRQLALSSDDIALRLVLGMVTRRYRDDAPTLIKANVPVNFLLPHMWPLLGQARGILLYLPLRNYLLAILRSDQHRDWLRRVTAQLRPHLGDLEHASDAQRAAALWSAQITIFAEAVAARGEALRTLDAETFFAAPGKTLFAAARHLALPIPREALDTIARGPLFATYSKNPGITFDNQARLQRQAAVEQALSSELREAEEWIGGRRNDALERVERERLDLD